MKQKTKSASKFLPVCEPLFNGREARYALQAVQSGWISSQGDFLKRFESGFAKYIGVAHGVATTNGTTALHLALVAAGVGAGDEVIIPDFTMIACAFAVCQTGARPVFVDADPETWTMDPKDVERKITSRTKVIMAVHIYGHPVDMDPIRELARTRNILILEDAAEAHGALYKKKRCGALGDLAAFSFYANKIITTGEGGMVVTNSPELYKQSLRYKNLCFPLDGNRSYLHDDIGFNYRMTNVQAAIGVAQLERIDSLVTARRRMAHRYLKFLKTENRLQLPVEKPWAHNVYWMFGVILKPSVTRTREEVMTALKKEGIDSRAFFQPMHRQPALVKAGLGKKAGFPVSDHLAARGFYLPSTGNLSEAAVARVCRVLRKALD